MFWKPSSKINTNIFVYDLETQSKFANTAEPLEMAGIVVNSDTLSEVEGGQFGPVLIKPSQWLNTKDEDQALQVNNLNREQIDTEGISQEEWFHQLVDFLQKFQKSKGKWDALISAGFNIVNYDNVIMNRLATKYKHVDKNGLPIIFHPQHTFDVIDLLRPWFFSNNEIEGYSLRAVSAYLGLENNEAHTAMGDIRTTMKIMQRFLNFHKALAPKYLKQFRGCFGSGENKNMINAKMESEGK